MRNKKRFSLRLHFLDPSRAPDKVKIVHSIVENILRYSWNGLQRIDLAHCPGIHDNDILNILVKCRRVGSVTLSFCVSERALMYTAVYATCLVELDVSGCCSATTTFVQAFLERHSSSLQKLILSDCMGLRRGNDFDEMVDMLGKSDNLRVLDISWTKKSYTACPFNECHVMCIIQSCKSLRALNLSGTVVISMTKHCQNLTSLSLGRTCLEDGDLLQITKYCKKLQYLDLSSCALLTLPGFESLVSLERLGRLILNNCVQLKGDSLSCILN
ncbi:SCF E3 ubiquitin ligase complex F-box protein grrA-like [Gigantopelta aegis]|uniref:SCF E3 ubiquitin ligase complex F-box protein grrA-like n=1 Tax=Gigantopelta aegis TaxID=1735272 RepID=UPI001B88B5E3|nr:SCF E3 ubiquitin ligase complex F-box protein grrA-like [Gigantopelta aegis]